MAAAVASVLFFRVPHFFNVGFRVLCGLADREVRVANRDQRPRRGRVRPGARRDGALCLCSLCVTQARERVLLKRGDAGSRRLFFFRWTEIDESARDARESADQRADRRPDAGEYHRPDQRARARARGAAERRRARAAPEKLLSQGAQAEPGAADQGAARHRRDPACQARGAARAARARAGPRSRRRAPGRGPDARRVREDAGPARRRAAAAEQSPENAAAPAAAEQSRERARESALRAGQRREESAEEPVRKILENFRQDFHDALFQGFPNVEEPVPESFRAQNHLGERPVDRGLDRFDGRRDRRKDFRQPGRFDFFLIPVLGGDHFGTVPAFLTASFETPAVVRTISSIVPRRLRDLREFLRRFQSELMKRRRHPFRVRGRDFRRRIILLHFPSASVNGRRGRLFRGPRTPDSFGPPSC